MRFGFYIRERRAALEQTGQPLSLRQFAHELGIEPAYLSKIERDVFAPPSEALIVRIALRLGVDPDVLLALGGKIATEVKAEIVRRPALLGPLIRRLGALPDADLASIVGDVQARCASREDPRPSDGTESGEES